MKVFDLNSALVAATLSSVGFLFALILVLLLVVGGCR